MNLQIGPVSVSISDGIIQWTSGMAADADGAPRAYAPAGSGLVSLDALGNAGHPDQWVDANKKVIADPTVIAQLRAGKGPSGCVFQKKDWWGLIVDANGDPIIQGPNDPATGFYVSDTSLGDPNCANTNPCRYVDASTVNFISIPKTLLRLGSQSVRLGDFCTVAYQGVTAGAIVGDDGPAGTIGEGSLATHVSLGVDPQRGLPNHKLLGIDSGVTFTIYLNSALTPAWPCGDVNAIALQIAATRSNFA